MTDTVLGKKSVVQIIWNSHVFKEWFQNNCKHVETYDGQGNQVKNFESEQTQIRKLPKTSWAVAAVVASCHLDDASDHN